MSEYLSPGTFTTEVASQLRAIEGASTSTAGFIGWAARGPVPGFPPPFTPGATDPIKVLVPRDDAPVLVTSLPDYTRTFGSLPDLPSTSDRNFLGHAVRAFFDNGGKRAYVGRVVHQSASPPTAARATVTLSQGTAYRLITKVRKNVANPTTKLDSLRGIAVGTTLAFASFDGNNDSFVVQSYDTQASTVTLTGTPKVDFAPETTSVVIGAPSSTDGPMFHARAPGSWGGSLLTTVANSDRGATPILAAVTNSDVIQVQTTGTFYLGAILEVDPGGKALASREYFSVLEILSATRVRVDRVFKLSLPITPDPPAFARVVEMDVSVVDTATGATEVFKGMTWGTNVSPAVLTRHYANVINTQSKLVYVQPPGIGTPTPLIGSEVPLNSGAILQLQPLSVKTALSGSFAGFPQAPTIPASGSDGGPLQDDDFVGVDNGPGARSGIQSLIDIEDVRIIAAPGETSPLIQDELITQCENLRYRFAVLDGDISPDGVTSILSHRNNYASSYCAYYTPWVQIDNGITTIELPPSGYMMGIYARVDNDRGVWKAPANEPLRNITGLQSYIATGEQDVLNPQGVNCIRRFEGRGLLAWGARTLSADASTKYVNVRRTLIFLEASLSSGTQWVVFEPNAPPTWSSTVDSVSAFLHTQWRDGALFGAKPEDAFYVRCDESTMSADDIQNGRLICNIGVAIVRPAEFVIFRIEQITGFSTNS